MRVSDERLRWLAARPATLSIAEALAMIDGVPEAAAELLRLREAIAAWNRSRAPAPASPGTEPRGCPTPGACSCPPAVPQGVETAISEAVAAVEQYHRAFPNLDQPVPRQRVHDTVLNLRTAIAAHVASEREAAIEELAQWFDDGNDAGWHDGAEVAAAIRARGGTNG